MTCAQVRCSSHTKVLGHRQSVWGCPETRTPLQGWKKVIVSSNFIQTKKVKQNEKPEEYSSNKQKKKNRRKTGGGGGGDIMKQIASYLMKNSKQLS